MGVKVRDYLRADEIESGIRVERLAVGRVDPPLYLESPALAATDPTVVAWHQGGALPVPWASWVASLPVEDQQAWAGVLPLLR
jgi:hypothetical protein